MTKRSGDLLRCMSRNTAFPVVLISTRDNVMTAAMVSTFSFNPPRIGVGVARERLTYERIRDEKAFVVNIPTTDMADVLNLCGTYSGRDHDKFALAGLTRQPADKVDSTLVAECPVNLECQVVSQVDVHERVWFIGQVLAVHEAEEWAGSQAMIYAGAEYRAVGEVVGVRV